MNKNNTRLIILDDEAHIIRLLKALIPWDELSITFEGSAQNGIDGKALIIEKKPDIVITDIKMPGSDGLSLIADVHTCLPETDFIIVSGFSQFDYAKKAIAYNVENYLLKPVNKDELYTTLEKLIVKRRRRNEEIIELRESGEQKRNSLFSQLIWGPDFPQLCDLKNFSICENETARLCIIKIDSTGIISPELYHLLSDKISAILTKNPLNRAFAVKCDIVCFLSAAQEKFEDMFREKLSQLYFDLQKIAEVFPQLRFTLFYGCVLTENLHSDYKRLLCMLPLRRKKDSPKIIAFEEVPPINYNRELLDSWNKNCGKILDCLDSSIAEKTAELFIQQILTQNENQQEALLVSALKRLSVKIEERLPSLETRFSEILLPALNLAGTTEELHGRFCAEIKKLIAETALQTANETIRPIRQADDYMRSHFMDYDISLEKVAEITSLSPSYFSTLYKKETGTGFLEALTAVRIKKAKELLQNGNKTIAKIAAAVGYTDIKYFSRVFKKTTGITPNEYRQFYS